MNELATLPYSVRKQIEEARALPAQDRQPDAQSFVRQAASELARSKPELCALIIASQQGYTQLCMRETEVTIDYQSVPKTFLGFELGSQFQEVKTTKVIEKCWRFSD